MKKSLFLLSLIIFSVTMSAKVYVCTAPAAINIRTQPSTQGSVVGALQPNQTVDVVVVKGDWAMINYNGATAYVAAKFLTEQQSLPTSRQVVSASMNTKVDKQETQEKQERQEKQSVVVSQEGRLNVNSTPDEAQLYVDSQYLGLTPYEMRLDCKNSHTIRLEKEGYTPFQQTILLDAGKTRNIYASLQKIKMPKIKVPKVKPQIEDRKLFLGASVGGGFWEAKVKNTLIDGNDNKCDYNRRSRGGMWSIGVESAYAVTPMIGVGGYFSGGQNLFEGRRDYNSEKLFSNPSIAVGALLLVGNYSAGKAAFLFGIGYEYAETNKTNEDVPDGIPPSVETSHLVNLRAGCLLECGVYIMCDASVGAKEMEKGNCCYSPTRRPILCDYVGNFKQYHIGLRVGYNFGRFIPVK